MNAEDVNFIHGGNISFDRRRLGTPGVIKIDAHSLSAAQTACGGLMWLVVGVLHPCSI